MSPPNGSECHSRHRDCRYAGNRPADDVSHWRRNEHHARVIGERRLTNIPASPRHRASAEIHGKIVEIALKSSAAHRDAVARDRYFRLQMRELVH